MELITINKDNNEIGNQLEFLIRKEFYITYNKFRLYPVYLLSWTILYVSLLLFTDVDSLITLKAVTTVLIAIFWLFSLIVFIVLAIKFSKRKIWKRKSIKAELLNRCKYQMGFDNEKIYFVVDSNNSEVLWNRYKFYSVRKTHLFLIPANDIYEATCISESEIGPDKFNQLLALATEKLILL